MKAQFFATILVSMSFLGAATAQSRTEPAGAPAIRLMRAALVEFAKKPELFRSIFERHWDMPSTNKEWRVEADYHISSANRMLDEVKQARSNPAHGYDTEVKTTFTDGEFGVDVVQRSATSFESKSAICKKTASNGVKSTYTCKVSYSSASADEDGSESLFVYSLEFDVIPKAKKIVPRSIEHLAAG
ncbi:MAG: hypothetical protein V4760_12130 [Bdellovibrionota bacterium]